ncbi:hypothetical protein BDW62DRAFT_194436 [Aspergillus aurantiobrunneus]
MIPRVECGMLAQPPVASPSKAPLRVSSKSITGRQGNRHRHRTFCATTRYQNWCLHAEPQGPPGQSYRHFTGRQDLATSSYSHIEIRNLATGDCNHSVEWTCSGHVALSPSGKLFAVASYNLVPPHSVLLLDVATGKTVQTFDVPKKSGALAISPDDKTVVAVVECNLFIWDVATGTRREVPLDLEGWYIQKTVNTL